MAASTNVASTTLANMAKEAKDNLFAQVPLLKHIKEVGGVEVVDGGRRIEKTVVLSEHSTLTEFVNGYEPYDLNVTDAFELATYDWADMGQPIIMPRKDRYENRGPEAVVNIVAGLAKQVLGSISKNVESELLRANVAGLTQLQSLHGVGTATGWLEEGTFTNQTNTVGGLLKSTYPLAWQNQVEDVASNFSANGLLKIRELLISMMDYADVHKWVVIASHASYALYGDSLQAQERYGSQDTLDGARMDLKVMSHGIYPSRNMGFTASDGSVVSMYFLNPNDLNLTFARGGEFDTSEFAKVGGYETELASVYIKMQMVTSRLSSQGLLLDADA